MADSTFGADETTTAYLQQSFHEDPSLQPANPQIPQLALAACILAHGNVDQQAWSIAPATNTPMKLDTGDEVVELLVQSSGNKLSCRLGNEQHEMTVTSVQNGTLYIIDKGIRQCCQYYRSGDSLYLQAFGESWSVTYFTHQPAAGANGTGSGRIQASMDGAMIDVLVEPGQTVGQGETLVILECHENGTPGKTRLRRRC